MRLDEVTQLAGGLCLHFANGDIVHMEPGEAWDAVDQLTVALERRARAFGTVRLPACEHKRWLIENGVSRCRDCGKTGARSPSPLWRVK